MKTPLQNARDIFKDIPYLNLATVSDEGKPWNSALWYARDEQFNLYFVSPKNTVHAKNIKSNGMGFVTIYDSTVPEGEGIGVYIDASVAEVSNLKEIAHAIACLYRAKKNKRQSIEFLSTAPRRIYKITPKKVWVNDATEEKGLYLDYRVGVPLIELHNPEN